MTRDRELYVHDTDCPTKYRYLIHIAFCLNHNAQQSLMPSYISFSFYVKLHIANEMDIIVILYFTMVL